MKKTYINPTLLVVKIKTEALMLITSGENANESDGFARESSFSDWEDEQLIIE